MTVTPSRPSDAGMAPASTAPDSDVLRSISQRVLWLAAAIVDAANRSRPNDSGVKVGGHQASSASMVDIMVALWFTTLRGTDRVSVQPHASPVLHTINYLLGDLDAAYRTTLRENGGLQSYPSRLKDPDTVDFSTGSVGIGATAALLDALRVVRELRSVFMLASGEVPSSRSRAYRLVSATLENEADPPLRRYSLIQASSTTCHRRVAHAPVRPAGSITLGMGPIIRTVVDKQTRWIEARYNCQPLVKAASEPPPELDPGDGAGTMIGASACVGLTSRSRSTRLAL